MQNTKFLGENSNMLEYTLLTCDNVDYVATEIKDGSSYTSFQLYQNETESDSKNNTDFKWLTDQQKLVVIDSVNSGKGRTDKNDIYSIVIRPIFERLKLRHEYLKTTSEESIKDFAEHGIDSTKNYTIVFISGDTSISELFNNLKHRNKMGDLRTLSILPIPMGTGNAWSSSLGLTSPLHAFDNFLHGNLRSSEFPLYKAIFPDETSILFIIILSLGFHANLLHACNVPNFLKIGIERFQLVSKTILETYDLNISMTTNNTTKEYAYFALINTPKLEPNYIPSPQSDALESRLHVLGHLKIASREQLTERIMQGYQNRIGQKLKSDSITYYELLDIPKNGTDITLNNDPISSPSYKFEVCCDGYLFNLDQMKSSSSLNNNKIHINTVKDELCFNLNVFSTKLVE